MTRRLTSITSPIDQFQQVYQESNSAWRTVLVTDGVHNDAFNRLRVSSPMTIFDSKQIFDSQPLFWDDQQTVGTGTSSTHSVDTASTVMGVSNVTTGTRVRQTFQRFNYQPGKSQLLLMTFVLGAGSAGITKRIGAFYADNGIFLEDHNGGLSYVERSKSTGSVVDTKVARADWDDPMDGTGESGIDLDFTKTQIMFLDIEWLGVGTVRFGFIVDGVIHIAYKSHHANLLSEVYISTPNLPLRYEISNSGSGGASTLKHICSSVMSEGGVDTLGVLRHIDNPGVSTLATGNKYAMLGIRLKDTHLGAVVKIEGMSSLSATANDQAHWELILNPVVTGTFTYVDQTNSAVQIATGAVTNTVTGGIEIDGGYFSTAIPQTITIPSALRLGSKIDGTRDTMVLVVRPITNNITVHASMTWRELS